MEIRRLKLYRYDNSANNSNLNTKRLIQIDKKINSYSQSKDNELNTNKQKTKKNMTTTKTNTNIKAFINFKSPQKTNYIPQKILKLSSSCNRSIRLRKSSALEKNRIYKKAFLEHFQPLLMLNNQYYPKNKRQININKEKSNTEKTVDNNNNIKPNTIFETYKNYQKQFFSSAFSLNITNLNNHSFTNINNTNKNKNINYHSAEKNDKYTSMSNTSLNKTNDNFNKKNKNTNNIKYNLLNHPRSVKNLLNQKNQDKIPMLLNTPVTFVKNFKSNSEKERDERNSIAILKLRNFLDKNWDKRLDYVREFFVLNKINDNEYYNNVSLENFAHFIHDNIDNDTNMLKGILETRIPMKQIIKKGIKFKNYSLKKLSKSNSMPSIKNKPSEKIDAKITKKMSLFINNFALFGRKRKLLSLNDKINNDKYQISEEGNERKNAVRNKVIQFRKFMDRNYAANVNNKFMNHYNEAEKINYFNKRKVGTISIPDKNNLFNSIKKQAKFFKLKSTIYTNKTKSIHSFSEKDFNDLYTELEQVKYDYINKIDKEPIDKDKENFWIKTYETLKKNKFEKQPENILKEKKKLLEYIIYQSIKERKEFERDILK